MCSTDRGLASGDGFFPKCSENVSYYGKGKVYKNHTERLKVVQIIPQNTNIKNKLQMLTILINIYNSVKTEVEN